MIYPLKPPTMSDAAWVNMQKLIARFELKYQSALQQQLKGA